MKVRLLTKIICDRRDCKNWVDGECSKEEVKVEERTISDEELAICATYEMVAAFC
jgi:hypothetical protein